MAKSKKYGFIDWYTESNKQLAERIAFEQSLQKNAETAFKKAGVTFENKKITAKTKTPMQPITLKNFIETYCNLSTKIDVQSKVSLLHEYNLKKKIKLPKLAYPYKNGQHKYYYIEDLKNHWPQYQIKMPTLPPLKQPANQQETGR